MLVAGGVHIPAEPTRRAGPPPGVLPAGRGAGQAGRRAPALTIPPRGGGVPQVS